MKQSQWAAWKCKLRKCACTKTSMVPAFKDATMTSTMIYFLTYLDVFTLGFAKHYHSYHINNVVSTDNCPGCKNLLRRET